MIRTWLPGLLLFFVFTAWGQPSWITYESRVSQYPESTYIVGFTSRYIKAEEDRNEVTKAVTNSSRVALSESIYVSISSQTNMVISTEEGNTSSTFEKNSVTKSKLDAFGLKSESYIDETNMVAYGFSYVQIKTLKSGYYNQYSSQMQRIKTTIEDAMVLKSTETRYKMLTRALKDLTSAQKMQDMLYYLGITNETALMKGDWKNYNSP